MTTTAAAEAPATRSRSSLSRRILIGLGAGLAVGVVFGDRAAAVLQPVADGYVKLLQMTVLPYVTISIIAGLGALKLGEVRLLSLRAGGVLVLLWGIAFTAVFTFPLMFPRQDNAAFFSTSMIEAREPFDVLGLYIPANPFNSLANNVVPAVVLFSIAVGVALIAIPGKERLLDVLDLAIAAVNRATNFIVTLTPYGVFALGAVAYGSFGPSELSRLQVYFVPYIAMATFLSLWVLPGLIAALTPIPYRVLLARLRDALLLAFMTTSLFAVLPMLTEEVKRLLRDRAHLDEHDSATPEVIVPVAFNFPHTGKVLALSFILFAAWFSDVTLGRDAYPRLAGAGLLAAFGSMNAAIPFLLDLFRIPADMFKLFIASGMLNARFGTLVSAVHTTAIAVLGSCAVTGALVVDRRKLTRYVFATVVMWIAIVGGVRVLLQDVFAAPYEKDQLLTAMEATRDRGPLVVFAAERDAPTLPPVTGSVLDRIRARGALRVGYFDDSLPFAFVNRRGALVGFDVEMATQLGRDLGVTPELVKIDRTVLDRGLDPALCDIVMSGVAVTADRVLNVLPSNAYLDETIAFIVPDHLAPSFAEWSEVRQMRGLRIGMPRAPYYVAKIRAELPDVTIVPIDRIEDMFVPRDPPLDAFVATAERGSAYTLLHPAYSVVVPQPRPVKVPLAYVIAGRDAQLAAVVNAWIDLKRKDGTTDELFRHWILGEHSARVTRPWSVVRNVLHWNE